LANAQGSREVSQLEGTNVLAMVEGRGVLSAAEVAEGLRYFEGFLTAQAEVVSALPGLREILRLARELGLTSYTMRCMLTWRGRRGCRWTRVCARPRRKPG
jgi:hypothetical protein